MAATQAVRGSFLCGNAVDAKVARARAAPASRIVCSASAQGMDKESVARGLMVGALVAGVTFNAPDVQALTLEERLERCTTDSCRSMIQRMEAARHTESSTPASAPAPGESYAERKAAEKAAAEKAAAEKAAAEKAAKAKAAKARSNKPNAFLSTVGYAVSAASATAVAGAGAATVLTGSTKELTDLDFDGWLKKSTGKWDSIKNKEVILATTATVVGGDALLHAIPILNLLPGLLEIGGSTVLGALLVRYLAQGKTVDKDIEASLGSLPAELPKVSDLTEKAGKAASGVTAIAKSVKLDTIPQDFEKAANDKYFVVGYSAALVVATLLLNTKVLHFPIISLFGPQLAEFVGFIALLYAINKYAVEGKSITDDLKGLKKGAKDLGLPGLE
eukprot:jgi/Mesvir1/22930/Mv19444-RA.1